MKNACMLNYDTLTVGEEHKVYLLVKVEGPPEESGREPLPINLSVVIDRSGSMAGEKLEYVKQAALALVRRLGGKDRLGLVAYDTTVQTLLAPQQVTDKTRFNRAVRGIRSGATTNLSGGWMAGCSQVGSALSDRGVNRVLLLTDGLANVGITEPPRLEALARQKRAAGISTTCFGVGMDFNEDLLTRMAAAGGGAFNFIDSPDQAPAFFAEELADLSNVVGQNLTIRVETESAVRAVSQLYDYPRHHDRGALVYQLGDLYAGEYQAARDLLREDRFRLSAGDVLRVGEILLRME
jgi:Ca-activated chloride channel family protein